MSAKQKKFDLFLEYKNLKNEYRAQNKALVQVLRFYAKDYDQGVAARAILDAWDARCSLPSPLNKHCVVSNEMV